MRFATKTLRHEVEIFVSSSLSGKKLRDSGVESAIPTIGDMIHLFQY